MKSLFLTGLCLLVSCSTFADFVYMKEDAVGKSVQLQSEGNASTLNEVAENVWAIYPDMTPDGTEYIYAEGEGQTNLHLTYFNKKTAKRIRLIPEIPGMILHPKFSKNKEWIFYSAPGPKGKNTIHFVSKKEVASTTLSEVTLTSAKILTPDEEAYFPRPSSDANFVVYQRNSNGKREIILFDRLENEKKVLAEGMSPALSFDERLIAYTSKKDGNWNIYVMDRVSGKITQMTSDEKDEQAPTFLPDNSLVFASNKTGHYRLYKLQGEKWEKLIDVSDEADVDFYSPQFAGETEYKQKELTPFIGNPRSSFGTVSHDGKIYMCGGHQGAEHTYPPESFSDQFIVYDRAENKWTELAPRPVKAHGYQIAASGNYIYAFGGFAYSPDHKPKWKSLDQIDRYDIKNNKWETIGKLSVPRSSNVAVTIDDKVYLAAGWNSTPKFENDLDGTFLDVVEVFDLKTEKISVAPFKLPNPLRRALTGINYQGKILLVGGLGVGASHFELISKVTLIDPLNGSFKELPELPFATFAPAAEVLKDELLVFGGMFKTGPMAYEYVSHIYGMNMSDKKWRHTGRFLKETKGFSQVFPVDEKTLGILGGHHYFEGQDSPVSTFETLSR